MKGERTEVRRIVGCVGCGRLAHSARELLSLGCEGQHTPFLEAAPLIESLEHLAGEYRKHAAAWAEIAGTRGIDAKRFETGLARGRALIYEENADDLRSLIESLNQETDTNAD
jgi:hypothetical protein